MAKAQGRKRIPETIKAEVEKTLDKIAIKPADVPDGGKLRLVEDDTGHRVLIYATDKGIRVDLRYEGDSLWATETQIAEMFGVTRQNVNLHLNNIYSEAELDRAATCKESLQVRIEGSRQVNRAIPNYNLDAIVSVGYRVSSKQGTMFRIWATDKLVQILTKGFYVDKERLKNPDQPNILTSLRETIREIRASSQNVWREVKAICALASDYNPTDIDRKRAFFISLENKLLWVATSMTGPEIIMERANIDKPSMGLTYHTGKRALPTQEDVEVANNYLAEPESKIKNRVTTMVLDHFEDQLDQGRLVTMGEIEAQLDSLIRFNKWPLLTHKGRVKGDDARRHARELLKQYKAKVKLIY